jgi:hypothetical protein
LAVLNGIDAVCRQCCIFNRQQWAVVLHRANVFQCWRRHDLREVPVRLSGRSNRDERGGLGLEATSTFPLCCRGHIARNSRHHCGNFGIVATTTFSQSCCEGNLATPFASDMCQGWQLTLSSPGIDPGANSAFLELLSNVPELQLIVFV